MNQRLTAQTIADQIRSDITQGRLPPGYRLPTIRDLARRYDTTMNTAAKAIRILEAEALVTAKIGSGVFVRVPHPVRRLGPDRYARSRWQQTTVQAYADDQPDSDAVTQAGDQTQETSVIEATEEIAAALEIQPGDQVYERARVITRDGVATHTMTSWYRRDDVEGTPIIDPRPGIAGQAGGFKVLTDQGLAPHEVTEDLIARVPTRDEMTLLELPPGEPVVEVHRITRTEDGRPVEYARGVHVASRFVWSYTFPIPD